MGLFSDAALRVVPVTLAEANALVGKMHRHHPPTVGHRWSIGVRNDAGDLIGAAICGRPVARMTNHEAVCEVTRLVTDGSENACSMLYGAAARIAGAMGFARIQTFILESEPGTSLRAAGWRMDGITDGGLWGNESNGGRNDHLRPVGRKQRWVRDFAKNKDAGKEPNEEGDRG